MTPGITRLPAGLGRLLLNLGLLSLPVLALVGSYLWYDPFQVLYHYAKFDEPSITELNRDYVSTQMYLNTYQRRPYQSFILGNSRTTAFRVADWLPYVHDTTAFHYDAYSESLYGVWKKLQFLEAHGAKLRNVLLVGDASLLAKTENFGTHLLRKDPRTLGEAPLDFQLSFLKMYLSNLYFYKYLKRQVTGRFTPDMEGALQKDFVYYDPVTNDLTLPDVNREIQRDSLGYYARNASLMQVRQPAVGAAVIGPAQLLQLTAIRNILRRHRTSFKLVISPLFDQQALNPADLAILQRLFGAGAVHDFSGVNEFTAQKGYYYEALHFRPVLGRKLLPLVYGPVR